MNIKSKSVLFFLPSLSGGGAERSIIETANTFSKNNHEVFLLISKTSNVYFSEISPKIKIIRLNSKRTILSLFDIRRELINIRPEFIYSALIYANILIIFITKFLIFDKSFRSKVFISERNNIDSLKQSSLGRIFFYLAKFFYRYSDGVIAVSDGLREAVVEKFRLPQSQVYSVPNGVDLLKINRLKEIQLDLPYNYKDRKYIVSVGRLTKQKDYISIINTFKILQDQDLDIDLVVLGTGEEEEFLTRLVQKQNISNVFFLGFLPNPFPVIKNAEIFLSMSKWEGMPNAHIQALACNTYIVSTDCKFGPREIIGSDKCGALCNISDYKAAANLIKDYLISQKIDLSPIKRSEYFSIEKSYRKLVEIFNK